MQKLHEITPVMWGHLVAAEAAGSWVFGVAYAMCSMALAWLCVWVIRKGRPDVASAALVLFAGVIAARLVCVSVDHFVDACHPEAAVIKSLVD